MRFDEYRKRDATALAGLIARREVTAGEVLEAAIARAEAVNPAINAIVHKQYDRARKTVDAGLPDGPMKGVPYLIKDLAFYDKGEPARLGSSLFADYVADHDSAYVARCKKAGLVIMGRSATPEFGLNPTTEPRLTGPCRNPWNLEHSAGGSSGGAAAAVVAGILPVAHATDGGGSIRIPAAQCGLFGLKPTRARMSLGPDAGEGWGGLSIGHVVSRSVRDSALMLDCTAGAEPGDPYVAPAPAGPFVEALARPPRRLRIALMLKDHRGAALHPECAKAVQGAAKLCERLGHIVEEADPRLDAGLDLVALRPKNSVISATNTARGMALRWKALGREPTPEDVEAVTWAVYQRGLASTGIEYVDAIAAVHAMGRRMAAFLADYDVILSTVLAGPPPRLGTFDQNGDVATFTERVTQYLSVTPLHNATGTPAMSVPLHWTAHGLPVGVHFAGRYGEEALLLQLAAQLETAQPWFDRLPSL
jgi:Asp-tRNA(Asn)/Glu-tRNA(Gln) amidotransferase A subunit family amidase